MLACMPLCPPATPYTMPLCPLRHKLLAIWRYPDATTQILEDHFRTVFSPPITAEQVKLLETACCVVRVGADGGGGGWMVAAVVGVGGSWW